MNNCPDDSSRLGSLLKNLQPELSAKDYVFCTLPDGQYGEYSHTKPLASFQEEEGMTLILEKQQAEAAQLEFAGVFNKITLKVYSDLESVGLTQAVSTALAQSNIPCNVIAAFHHDHILVPSDRANEALEILHGLSTER